ncbi:MAG: GNAT family N-acetyltransferase [Desulfobacterales bacterium]|nr:GNAT family N-acetyltransferase [Desulfobacterales bacterium]
MMVDMLVKLYDIKTQGAFLSEHEGHGIELRKPIGPEKHAIIAWVFDHFGDGWASEVDVALSNQPPTCWVAVRDNQIIGFACYDATALGFFGPIGVAQSHRDKGIGTALMKACLQEMKNKGYGYAVIGGVEDTEFYKHTVGALEIPDSAPGIYKNQVKGPQSKQKK